VWGGGGGLDRNNEKILHTDIEQFQHYLNKCNGNIILVKISNLFPSASPKFFFLLL
jgi:hypothetical protein